MIREIREERKEIVCKCSESQSYIQTVPQNLARRLEGRQARFYVSSTETQWSFLRLTRDKPPRGIWETLDLRRDVTRCVTARLQIPLRPNYYHWPVPDPQMETVLPARVSTNGSARLPSRTPTSISLPRHNIRLSFVHLFHVPVPRPRCALLPHVLVPPLCTLSSHENVLVIMYVCVQIYVKMCKCISTIVYTYIHIYVYMYIHIYAHTHTHS